MACGVRALLAAAVLLASEEGARLIDYDVLCRCDVVAQDYKTLLLFSIFRPSALSGRKCAGGMCFDKMAYASNGAARIMISVHVTPVLRR